MYTKCDISRNEYMNSSLCDNDQYRFTARLRKDRSYIGTQDLSHLRAANRQGSFASQSIVSYSQQTHAQANVAPIAVLTPIDSKPTQTKPYRVYFTRYLKLSRRSYSHSMVHIKPQYDNLAHAETIVLLIAIRNFI